MNQYWGRYEGILIPSLAGDAYAIYSSGWAAPVPGSNTTHWPSSNDDTLRYTSGVGETVDIKFYGSAIGVLAWMHPYNYRIPGFNRGALYKVQVFIDGVPYPVVEVQDDSPSDESSAPRSRLLFDSGLLTLGTHTLTIKNLLGCSQLPLVLHSFQIVSTGEIHPHLLPIDGAVSGQPASTQWDYPPVVQTGTAGATITEAFGIPPVASPLLLASPIFTGYPDYLASIDKETEKGLAIGLGLMSALSLSLIIFIIFRFFKDRKASKKKANSHHIGDKLGQSERAFRPGDDDSMREAKA